jgi:hypothetical protein
MEFEKSTFWKVIKISYWVLVFAIALIGYYFIFTELL